MDLKKPYTLDEQIKKLTAHGVVIADEAFARNVLQKVSYYRLSGYMLQYRLSTDSHEMIKGICFEDIYTVYCFDEELRTLLRQYIEKAEVQFNTLYDRQLNNWLHAFLYKKGYSNGVGIEMRKAYEDGRVKNADEFEEVLKDVLRCCKGQK